MVQEIHALMDMRVDVYSENARFTSLLEQYHSNRDESLLSELITISFRCAANILKSRIGQKATWEEIADKAMDMTLVLMKRINNYKRYPEGYKVKNLPTVMKWIFLNVLYAKKPKEICFTDMETYNNYEQARSAKLCFGVEEQEGWI